MYEKICPYVMISVLIPVEKCVITCWLTPRIAVCDCFTVTRSDLFADSLTTFFSELDIQLSNSHIHFPFYRSFQRIQVRGSL